MSPIWARRRASADGQDTFLLDESADHESFEKGQSRPPHFSCMGGPAAWIFHVSLITTYSIAALLIILYYPRTELIASPANGIIEYERRTWFPVTYNNPFTGKPRPELDAAWHDLLRYAHVRVSKEELEAANYTSLIFKDGTGYVAQLASTHQLHCIKQIRRYLHHGYYMPHATADELEAQGMHIDHCLEVLRLSTMCSGDVSLTPFYLARTEEGLYYPFVKSRTYHQCANWDRIQKWSASRAVNLFDPDLLELPAGAKLLQQPVPEMVLDP